MEQQKAVFVTNLADLLAGRSSSHWGKVLEEAFAYFRNCNQLGIVPTSLFTPEERSRTNQQIIDALPLLNRDFQKRVNILGLESAQRLRMIRSGLEFIKENFTVDNARLQRDLETLMEGYEVQSLEDKLFAFKDDRGEYDDGSDPIDLRGVPESHDWWSTLERDDTVRVFGR